MLVVKCCVFGVFVFCLLGCSEKNVQTAGNSVGDSANSQNINRNKARTGIPVSVIGYFTNVQSDGEHQSGYTVQIWNQENQIFGLFSGSSGSITVGDPPTAILVNQQFNKNDKAFSFEAAVPAYTYIFDGTLSETRIAGRLLNSTSGKSEDIVLQRSNELSSEMMEGFENYYDWKTHVDKILDRRGRP